MPKTVWITGARGLIGRYLVETAPRFAPWAEAIGLTRADLNILDFPAVERRFRGSEAPSSPSPPPDFIIHCAALSNSPVCENDPALAHRMNVEATANLARLAAEIPFIFFSSDLVFDGRHGSYTESSPTNPLSVYGHTKRNAEGIVLRNPRHSVVRTSLNLGISASGDRGLNEQMRLAWMQGKILKLFTDEFRCPIPAVVTAQAVWELAAKNQPGLYHVCGAERLSRYRIGQLVAGRCPEVTPRIEAASIEDFTGPPRPADTSLDCSKAQKLLSFSLPKLSEWIAEHSKDLF